MPPASQHQLHRGPGRTAVLTAVARALHREEPRPWVMDDDLALGLAGREGRALLGRLRAKAPRPYLLAFSRWTCVRPGLLRTPWSEPLPAASAST